MEVRKGKELSSSDYIYHLLKSRSYTCARANIMCREREKKTTTIEISATSGNINTSYLLFSQPDFSANGKQQEIKFKQKQKQKMNEESKKLRKKQANVYQ